MSGLSRRQLFGNVLGAGRRIAATATDEAEAPPQRDPIVSAELEAIAGDFPPEMLRMEAERLGLDPETLDRSQLLAAVYEAMAAGREPRDSGETE